MTSSTFPQQSTIDAQHVLGRRVVAWLIDALIVGLLVAVLHAALAVVGLLTLGLGWMLFALVPLVPFAYSFCSLASRHAATPGQRLMHLAMVEHASFRRPTPLEAFVATAIFYLSFSFPPVFLVALFTPHHRTLHDLLSGLLMVRSQPLTVAHGAWNMHTRTTD